MIHRSVIIPLFEENKEMKKKGERERREGVREDAEGEFEPVEDGGTAFLLVGDLVVDIVAIDRIHQLKIYVKYKDN